VGAILKIALRSPSKNHGVVVDPQRSHVRRAVGTERGQMPQRVPFEQVEELRGYPRRLRVCF
jgi:hypothetical protein